MSSFFTLPASQRKRKRQDHTTTPKKKKRGVDASGSSDARNARNSRHRDASLSESDIEEDEITSMSEQGEDESGSESDEDETAADRRLRLAERYLENVRDEVDEAGFDAAEIDRDMIAERLKEDVDEFKGRAYRQVASQLSFLTASYSFFRADTQSTTCVAVHAPYVYTVSKDKALIKWELASPGRSTVIQQNECSKGHKKRPCPPQRRKPKILKFTRGLQKVMESGEDQGHTKAILSVAVSPSGKFVATGGADRKLIIWDAETLTPTKTFTQHRDAVSGLAFVRHISAMSSGEQLFSGSLDRTIKTWSVSVAGHAYVETLFGHQDSITSVAAMAIDQCVSVGARDRTARLWKVIDESQLVFRGGSSKNTTYHENNLDCVAPVPPHHFVTGSDSGALSLWSVHKKKPLFTIPLAHGLDPLPPLDKLSSELDENTAASNTRLLRRMPRWITALATLPGTDVVLTGSWDGWIRAWQISEDKKTIRPLGPIGQNAANPLAQGEPFRQASQPSSQATDGLQNQGNDGSMREPTPLIRGVVNSIAVFERRPETSRPTDPEAKLDSSTSQHEPRGLCIIAAVGKEHRLGSFKCFANNSLSDPAHQGRNGAVVFEVPFLPGLATLDSS